MYKNFFCTICKCDLFLSNSDSRFAVPLPFPKETVVLAFIGVLKGLSTPIGSLKSESGRGVDFLC